MRALIILLCALLAACTSDSSLPTIGGTDDSTAVRTTDAPPQRPLRLADLATVCEGQGEAQASALPTDASEPPRLLVLVRDSTAAAYRSETSDVYFRDWGISGSGSYPETEVVACLTGFPGDFVRTCEFDISSSDSTYYLDLYGASYNVRLRAAQTGELLEEFGLDAAFRTCPMLHTFSGDGRRERALLDPPMDDLKAEVLARLAPDYDPRREFMDADDIRELDSLEALADSVRRLRR